MNKSVTEAYLDGILETDSVPGQGNVEEECENKQGKISWNSPKVRINENKR
jgi:hypothetical protein